MRRYKDLFGGLQTVFCGHPGATERPLRPQEEKGAVKLVGLPVSEGTLLLPYSGFI